MRSADEMATTVAFSVLALTVWLLVRPLIL
jgi:hypothetical protein